MRYTYDGGVGFNDFSMPRHRAPRTATCSTAKLIFYKPRGQNLLPCDSEVIDGFLMFPLPNYFSLRASLTCVLKVTKD